jgi:ribonuclease P protein component
MSDTPPAKGHRFRPYEHLRRPADFRRVYNARRSVSNDWLIVYACLNERGYSRLGLSVSRKYGGAVQRNRLRRLYREAYRLTKLILPTGLDVVLIPRGKDERSLRELTEALPKLIGMVAKKLNRDVSKSRESQP